MCNGTINITIYQVAILSIIVACSDKIFLSRQSWLACQVDFETKKILPDTTIVLMTNINKYCAGLT